MAKHIISEFTEFDEAASNSILDKLVNENKLIKKKYAQKDMFSLPRANNKTESDKKNPGIADFQGKIMALNEFVLSEFHLLKKEAKALSASNYVSVGNNNSSDPKNVVTNEGFL